MSLALLRLELDTIWASDPDGTLLAARRPDPPPPPLVVVAAAHDGATVACGPAIPADAVAAIRALVDDAPPQPDPHWRPAGRAEILRIVAAVAPAPFERCGPSYVIDATPPPSPDTTVVTSEQCDVGELHGLADDDRELGLPWAVATVDGAVAAVCETSRATELAIEAGVHTYGPYRRRGLASAAVAAWSGLGAGRTVFYSTDWHNDASLATARRVGARPIGAIWQLASS